MIRALWSACRASQRGLIPPIMYKKLSISLVALILCPLAFVVMIFLGFCRLISFLCEFVETWALTWTVGEGREELELSAKWSLLIFSLLFFATLVRAIWKFTIWAWN